MKTPERPVLRHAARAVLIDPAGRVLLIRGVDPAYSAAGSWWITPGGGLEPGEDHLAAAAREVLEETGQDVRGRLRGPVLHRTAVFPFDNRMIDQRERYYVAHVDAFVPSDAGWTAFERGALGELRWWTVDELRRTDETVYPTELADLIEAAVGA